MVNFLIFVHKNVYRIRFQKIKIRPLKGFEKKAFFSLLLMRKRLSGGQKWFLKPYFPLIRGMFVFRSGLRFSFRALEVPEPRVRKRPFSLSKMTIQFNFSSLFHERLHDRTTSNSQNHELERSRPVVMLKLNIIVTLSMLEPNFATLHTKNTIVIKIEKWQIVLIEGLSRVAVRGIDPQQL